MVHTRISGSGRLINGNFNQVLSSGLKLEMGYSSNFDDYGLLIDQSPKGIHHAFLVNQIQ